MRINKTIAKQIAWGLSTTEPVNENSASYATWKQCCHAVVSQTGLEGNQAEWFLKACRFDYYKTNKTPN